MCGNGHTYASVQVSTGQKFAGIYISFVLESKGLGVPSVYHGHCNKRKTHGHDSLCQVCRVLISWAVMGIFQNVLETRRDRGCCNATDQEPSRDSQ